MLVPFDHKQLESYPTQPGVYLMKDNQGTILYVGKAKNIRQRVRQYFLPGRDGRPQVPFLVAKVAEVETLVVTSEKEALLLEDTLIKQYQPKYNALLKDDKTYVALKVNHKHAWPMVQIVRYKGRPEPDGLYFGPYTSAHAARMTLDLIHRLFPLRQCSDQELARRTRPCILHDMKQCMAPCVHLCTREQYEGTVDRALRFLRGQDREILKELYKEMEGYAQSLEFERAQQVLTLIRQIEKTLEGQKVVKPLGGDADILAIYRHGDEAVLVQLLVREGKLLGSRHFQFDRVVEEDAELLRSFLLQEYREASELPQEILLPCPLEEAELIAEILSSERPRRVRVYTPVKGDKRALVEMAYLNAESLFKRERDQQTLREKTLLEMQERLQLNQYPKRMECYDNSNLAGKEPVSAMVTFMEGVKEKRLYRKYKVKTVSTPDDYATMYEVLMRRLSRGKEENDLPDLLIIDGGKGHLNVGLRVLKELNIITVDIIAVAKEQGRHDKGITSEQIFLPGRKDPVILRRNSPVLLLLQQIRDEAHRFALTFHRARRSKQTIRSSLIQIPGIGPKKQKLLLKHFGSVKRLKEASREEFEAVKGLSKANVEALIQFSSSSTQRRG